MTCREILWAFYWPCLAYACGLAALVLLRLALWLSLQPRRRKS